MFIYNSNVHPSDTEFSKKMSSILVFAMQSPVLAFKLTRSCSRLLFELLLSTTFVLSLDQTHFCAIYSKIHAYCENYFIQIFSKRCTKIEKKKRKQKTQSSCFRVSQESQLFLLMLEGTGFCVQYCNTKVPFNCYTKVSNWNIKQIK